MRRFLPSSSVTRPATLLGAGLALAACAHAPSVAPKLPAGIPPTSGSFTERWGLWYQDVVEGRGAEVQDGQCVYVNYTGWNAATGREFETSKDPAMGSAARPFVFAHGSKAAIQGWDIGIKGMRIGGTRRLIIPPRLAYGDAGSPPKVPKRATLVFDIELVALGTPLQKATPTKPAKCPEW